VVTQVVDESPAALAGLKANDTLLKLTSGRDTLETLTPSTVRTFIQQHGGKELQITRSRSDGESPALVETLTLTPVQGVIGSDTKPAIGIAMGFTQTGSVPLWDALGLGLIETQRVLHDTVTGLWSLLVGAFVGTSSLDDISGPVGIAGQVGSWYDLGFVYLAYFTAIISVNLAVINLIPIPALDGGRIMFVMYEAASRRRIPASFATSINTIGFVLLIALMLVVTWSDVWKLVG
jgi:regulator of sigma E protease